MTHYSTLGVPTDASPDQIKAAYRKVASAAHPDRAEGDAQAMAAINEAYRVLSDPELRQHYDQTGKGTLGPSVEDEAMSSLASLFGSLLDSEAKDILGEARKAHQEAAAEFNRRKQHAERMLQQAKAAEGRVWLKAGAEAPNLWAGVLSQRVARAEAQLEACARMLAVNKAVGQLLRDYEQEKVAPKAHDQRDPYGELGNTFDSFFRARPGWTTGTGGI